MDLTKNYEELDFEYCRASTSIRFVNYIIDIIFFYLILFCLGITVALINPAFLDGDENSFLDRIISLLLYGLFMFLIEGITKGKSIGKLITGTKAVNLDGSDIDFGKAFSRNFIRAIPFNVFSALGSPCNPWHDRLSNTMVIDEKKVALQKQKAEFFGSYKHPNEPVI